MVRVVGRTLFGLVLAFILLYLGDFAVWKLRGEGGVGSVEVTRFVVAPLKGGKEEYYPDGTETVECSRSLFSQAPAGACWQLQRHRVVFDR